MSGSNLTPYVLTNHEFNPHTPPHPLQRPVLINHAWNATPFRNVNGYPRPPLPNSPPPTPFQPPPHHPSRWPSGWASTRWPCCCDPPSPSCASSATRSARCASTARRSSSACVPAWCGRCGPGSVGRGVWRGSVEGGGGRERKEWHIGLGVDVGHIWNMVWRGFFLDIYKRESSPEV